MVILGFLSLLLGVISIILENLYFIKLNCSQEENVQYKQSLKNKFFHHLCPFISHLWRIFDTD